VTTEPAEGATGEETAEEEREDPDERVDTSHLDDVDDGCGCAEVWEHLSERRDD
jgi:hypothetical protein